MTWDYLLNGLGMGAIFAFIALGYTMVYGIIRLINFAHGEFFMFGAFVGYFVLRDSGLSRLPLPHPLPTMAAYFAALTAASLAAGTLAVVVERVAYRPVRKSGRITALITAVCVSLLLQNLAIKAWEASPRAYPDPRVWSDVARLPDRPAAAAGSEPAGAWYHERRFTTTTGIKAREERVVVPPGAAIDAGVRERLRSEGIDEVYRTISLPQGLTRLFIILALALWTPVLWFIVKRTKMGKAMRAVSEDMDAARLMGISINRIVAATFFLGAFIAGVGGVAYCVSYGKVEPLTGFLPGIKAFVAAVIGGIGSIPGAIVGGLLLGIAESVIPYALREGLHWESAFAWKDAIAFALLIVILVVKPSGLLGRTQRVKV